jgi:UDP-glucose 4-epimerase
MKSDRVNDFYNVGTGIKTSLKELAELLCKITSFNKGIQYKANNNKTFVKNRIGSPEKAIQELDYKYEISLEEGLSQLIDWRNEQKKNDTYI